MSSIFGMTDTWNNGALSFDAISMDVTDTASLAASNLLNLKVAGVSKFAVQKDGQLIIGALTIGATTATRLSLVNSNGWAVRANMRYSWGSGTTDAGGGADTAVGRNAAGIVEVNNGTAGTFADLIARNLRTNPTTVASLTAAATAGVGARSFVTDALTPAFGATVAAGGAVATPVYSDGAAWKVG